MDTVSKSFSYEWKIPNFRCSETYNLSPSTTFNFDNIGNDEEFVGVLSIGGARCSERSCRFALQSTTHNMWMVLVKLCPTAKLLSGSETRSPNVALNQDKTSMELMLYDYNYNRCLLAGGIASIKCVIYFQNYRKTNAVPGMERFTLNCCLLELMKSQKYWDVTIVVDGRETHAHKAILTSRSKVFAAMFDNESEEAKSNKVIITDIEFEVFEQVLLYMYTDDVENLTKMPHGLLAASEKYDLPELKKRCERALIKNLDIVNAAEILILADLYSAGTLKKDTIDFISKNSKAVSETEGFEMIKDKKNSHLLLELYLATIN